MSRAHRLFNGISDSDIHALDICAVKYFKRRLVLGVHSTGKFERFGDIAGSHIRQGNRGARLLAYHNISGDTECNDK